jgi:hypothetical protein
MANHYRSALDHPAHPKGARRGTRLSALTFRLPVFDSPLRLVRCFDSLLSPSYNPPRTSHLTPDGKYETR